MAACIHMLSLRVCVGRLSSGLRKTLKGPFVRRIPDESTHRLEGNSWG